MPYSKHTFRNFFLVCFLAVVSGCKNGASIDYSTGATPPSEAVSTFELEDGFKIELIAAEPLLADPVDMEIDEYGRLYVVEMHGYPLDKSGSGKIKLLSDSDGDGKMDKSTVFAEGLVLPNGITRWKKGVLVTDAPNVLYLEDADGDGKADIRDTVLTGFSLSNPHINANNPVYGIDNWIHIAHRGAITTRNYQDLFGDEGAEIYFPDQPTNPRLAKNAESHSIRFRPDQHLLELTSGQAQFGHTFDAWGHHLFADNQNHAFAEVFAAPYMRRNPELNIGEATEPMSDHGHVSEVYQITKNPERQMFSGVGVMTSSSGVTAYLGGLFPAPFDKNISFVCESVSNLVHVDKIRDTGAAFISSRVGTPRKEFLASRDAWSRPVNLYIGPDGALYMIDYYRKIIEHPEWMSDEAIAAGGLYDGKDMGRIYRITPPNAKPAEWTKGLKLGDAKSEELVEKLADPNIWWRINAQRLLVDRNDRSVVPALVQLTKDTARAEGRLHALWTLEGLGELKSEQIETALEDAIPGIRENAIRFAEIHMGAAPELAKALLPLQNDKNARVRFQLLCTLGFLNSPESELARQKILFSDVNDKWVQIAALSAASSKSGALLNMVLKNFKPEVPAYASLIQRLTNMVGARGSDADIKQLIKKSLSGGSDKQAAWQAATLEGLAQGLQGKDKTKALVSEQESLIRSCFNNASANVRKASFKLLKSIGVSNEARAVAAALDNAADIAGNRQLTDDKRVEAINFMSLRNPAPHVDLLKKLIVPQEEPAVQMAALKTLSLVPGNTVTAYVLQQWSEMTPGIRDVALSTFMTDSTRKTSLLQAIEKGTIQQASLGWSRSAQLMGESNDKLRNKARELLVNKEEEKINREFQKALELKGDMAKGKIIFQENCGLCHQVRGAVGIAFGPDLGTIQNWLAKDIMANVLAPDLSIAVGFDLWAVELKTGETLQGIISSETSSAIHLRMGPGAEKTINRRDVQSLKVMNTSAMPVLSQKISHQQMADLIAFLRQTK